MAAVAAAFKLGWMIGSNIELGVALAAHPHLAASTLGLDPHVPCDLLSPFYYEADVIAEPLPSDPIAPCLRKDRARNLARRGSCDSIPRRRLMPTITVLGSGTPTPTAERWGSAFLVQVDDALIMFDCGPSATLKLVQAGFWPTDVDYLFFTHHHFDHDVDYPAFLLTRWDQSIGDENELQVFGPAPTEQLTEMLIGPDGAFAHDWKARINHPASQQVFVNRGGTLPRPAPSVNANDVGPGVVYEGSTWTQRAAPAVHVQPYLDSLAFRLETPSASIVFTGDTKPCDSVVELANGSDVMLCMCWDHQANMVRTGETLAQCGTTGAAEMAAAASVDTLVLVHTGPNLSPVKERAKAIGDIREIYPGRVAFAEELMQLDVPTL